MKTRIAFLFLVCTVVLSTAVAQSREDDDMYFTPKDRAVLNAASQKDRQEIFASSNVRRITESETAATINPTDSYSSRNVNPEYISGAKVGTNNTANAQYFSPNYQPTAVNQNLASNYTNVGSYNYNGFNNGFGYSPYNRFGMSGMYGMGGFGMMSPFGYGNYGMMNPYYGYDPFFMRGNGFYGSGFSMGFGSGFGYGMGGFGNSFGNPYGPYGMNGFYGGFQGTICNGFYGNNNWGGGNTVVIVDRPRPNSARGEEIDRYYSTNGNRGGSNSGGRVATTDNSQQYYNRAWRNDAATPQRGSTTWNNTRSYQQNYNGWNDNTNSNRNNWGGSNGGINNGGFSGGRSSGFSGGGGAAPSGGGGGGARRGRD